MYNRIRSEVAMNSRKVVEMLLEIADKIESEKEYVTELDAVLGDGDHWVNINKGYQAIAGMADELMNLPLNQLFSKVGMSIMSVVGGSSGVLYGDAFLRASKTLEGKDEMTLEDGCVFLETALNAMMSRGKAQPGDKTMIDPLNAVVQGFKEALKASKTKEEISDIISKAAYEGMLKTKDMIARKGRATYREDKGVGYIDAGAATMYYQLDILGQYIKK